MEKGKWKTNVDWSWNENQEESLWSFPAIEHWIIDPSFLVWIVGKAETIEIFRITVTSYYILNL